MRTSEEIIKEMSDFKFVMNTANIDTDNIVYLLPLEDIRTLKKYLAISCGGNLTESQIKDRFSTVYGIKVMAKDR